MAEWNSGPGGKIDGEFEEIDESTEKAKALGANVTMV
jgi:hypothetical protein